MIIPKDTKKTLTTFLTYIPLRPEAMKTIPKAILI